MATPIVNRSKLSVLVAAVLAVFLIAGQGAIAHAQPGIDTASDAQTRLAELSRESEQTTEALHNAQIDLDAKIAAQRDADAALAANQDALTRAQQALAELKPAMDKVANVNYQGGRTNRLFAVMVSDSPQQLLDQMSALDIISAETTRQVEQFKQASADAAAAQEASQAAVDLARTAAEQARVVSDDLQAKQSQLQEQTAEVVASYNALSGAEQAELAGSPLPEGFDLSKFGSAPTKFDEQDLYPLTGRFLQTLAYADVAEDIRALGVPDALAERFWTVTRENISTKGELKAWWEMFRDGAEPVIAEEDAAFVAEAMALLPEGPFDGETWGAWTGAVKAATGRKGRGLFMPLRKALTGQEHGPDMGALLPLIGRDRALRRLQG